MKKFVILFFSIISSINAQTNQIFPPGYAVATAHPLATNAGLEILAAGGNAFDAAVAVSAVLAVVEPYHSGLGGGGFWLLHLEREQQDILVDGREVAPLAAHKDMFLDANGKPVPGLSLNGGLAAAIPGEPAALSYIAKHYGRLPLATTLAPAIRLAENGFIVDEQFHYFSTMADRLSMLKRFPATAAVFLNKGKPYEIGQRLKQPDLANTLKLLANQGHDGFYRGKVAEQLVKAVADAGGVWSLNDLAQYQVKLRTPLHASYHNVLITTAPPPSGGGVALITMLNILSPYPLEQFTEAKRVHFITEAMRLAYWQRERIGDPDFSEVPLEQLLSAENAGKLRQYIREDKATASIKLPKKSAISEPQHTTHISILDKEGNRVSATMTVNFIFGSSVVAAGTGVLLNDEMDDFSSKVGEKNVFGVVGSQKNSIAPGKRPVSSMTPTFLETPNRLAIVGTPGGSRIPTMILLATLVFEQFKGAISMVSAMRFHHQYLPDVLQFEPETFSPAVQEELKRMGYQLMALTEYFGDMQAISWDKNNNVLTAASDPRHMGLAAVLSNQSGGYGVNY
ncbi:gamma-glutamyltransferase [Legionella jordanis]|uniref:Glutathione hydrolase proenzyme n=1 Tax=Legionella jordanis TaxID=456 RepID=A0A0W0VDK1_9GAMM|nr:gamma-glutamyltransferase [Legionella jordanis]KTD18190.1 gamma-glutamyltranspeptidase [Legionella jordanis]RMX01150.1 gamma-glutamyltransferase [Legionella jordanis]RMX21380.1 gamma-glutamyltransferase [Legionella jordanis]VEH13717.1 gamma-glutamyltranspeptidase [Legionella jordanis]